MEDRLPLAQLTAQTLGSLRALCHGLKRRHFIPPDLRSLAEALEQIFSKKLDDLLKLRLEEFSRRQDDVRRKTVKDSLHSAGLGLGFCIDVLNGMSAQDTWTQSRISEMNYGWEIFNYQMGVVVKIVVVEEEERYRLHLFTDRSKTVIAEPDTMSVTSSSYQTIESMKFQSLQRPPTIKQPQKKSSGFFGLTNRTTTTLPVYTERPEANYESADEEIPRNSLDEKAADEKPRRFFSLGPRKGRPQGNGPMTSSGVLRRTVSQTGPILISSNLQFDINMEKSADGRKVIVDANELSNVMSNIKIEVTAASTSGPVQVLPVFFQPVLHDKLPTATGDPKRLTKRQPQSQATRPSVERAQTDSFSQVEEIRSPPISHPVPSPPFPQNQLVPIRSQELHPYKPNLPPRPTYEVTSWNSPPPGQTPPTSPLQPPRPYQHPLQHPHLHPMTPRSRPGFRETLLNAAMNSALDLLHPSIVCPCSIRHTSEPHAMCVHCPGQRCPVLY